MQIAQVLWHVLFRTVTRGLEAAEQIDPLARQREAVAEARTWQVAERHFDSLPLPFGGVELVQVIRVLAVFDHAAENVDFVLKAGHSVRCAARRHLAPDFWHKPLICR